MKNYELLREFPRNNSAFKTYEVEIINDRNLSDSLSVSKNSIKSLFDELLKENCILNT